MRPLRTERLRLEPLVRAHAAAMFPLLQDPTLYTWVDHGPPPSLVHLENVYARREARQSPDGRERWLNWIVLLDGETAQAVGIVQATVLQDGRAWVAYEFPSAFRGRGYAREAVAALLLELAASFGVQHLQATVEQDNLRSILLLLKLGFEPTAPEDITTLTATERLYTRPAHGACGARQVPRGFRPVRRRLGRRRCWRQWPHRA